MERAIPYISISDAVDEFFGGSINSNRKHYINYLVNAKWVWKKIARESLFTVCHKYIKIDKTTTPHSIVIPKYALRVFGVSFVDGCGNNVAMRRNDDMVTLPKLSGRSCTCTDCECDGTLCGIDTQFTVRTREIQIDGQYYLETIWNRKLANGDIVEIRRTPFQDYYTQTDWKVSYQDQQRVITSLEVKPCGCVKNSAENKKKLADVAIFTNACHRESFDCFEGCSSGTGEFKIAKNGRAYLRYYNPDATHAILNFQTNEECPAEEIMIPEDAVDALHFGMIWRTKALSGANRLEVREAKRQFGALVDDLEMFRQPVSIEEFLEVQGIIPKWGAVIGGCSFDLSKYERTYTQSEVDALVKESCSKDSSSAPGSVPPMNSGDGVTPSDTIHYNNNYAPNYS